MKESSFKKKKIGVLMGGLSREREISLRTGKAIHKALLEKGYTACAIDVGRDIAESLIKKKIDIAFIALHGRYGEDGTIQGMLELMGIPYTGSSVLASAGGNIIDPSTGAVVYAKNSPGPSFEAQVGVPLNVKWVNNIVTPHMFPVDPTLHWADPNNMSHVMVDPLNPVPYPPGYPQAQSPVPLVTHLHGAEVRSISDGGPEAWWTNGGLQGMDYNTEEPTDANAAVYRYPNSQLPTTLWYHDHALGITRINVMSGLAGFYLLRDPTDPIEPLLPGGQVIHDHSTNEFLEDTLFLWSAVKRR